MSRWLLMWMLPWALFGAQIVCDDVSFADETVAIRVEDVEGEVALRASLLDDKGQVFRARATFLAEGGVVDLKTCPALGGSYEGIDPMGLFWSMEGERDPSFHGDFFYVDFEALVDEEVVAKKRIKRVILSDEVEVFDVAEEGLVGVLYLPKGAENVPVVITLTGSNGGVSKKRAALMASHGIPSLALGYFRAEGLPTGLEEIPLEYFETAFSWVERHPRLSGEMSLYGVSRGGELALLLGALFPERFEKIVAAVPSSVVYASLVDHSKSAWMHRGEAVLPSAPVPDIPLSPLRGLSHEDPLSTSDFLLGGRGDEAGWEAARIPVEKIQAQVYVFGGRDDQMWPSGFFVEEITERMDPANLKWEIYEQAGHGIGIPYLPASTLYFHPVTEHWFTMGGTPQENDRASQISWNQILEFLQ